LGGLEFELLAHLRTRDYDGAMRSLRALIGLGPGRLELLWRLARLGALWAGVPSARRQAGRG
jgi:hypothetical protein